MTGVIIVIMVSHCSHCKKSKVLNGLFSYDTNELSRRPYQQ